MSSRDRRKPRPTIAELRAEIPEGFCKGLCADSCTVIDLSPAEARRLPPGAVTTMDEIPGGFRGLVQRTLTEGEAVIPRCPSLTDEGRCAVYAERPLICRLYGAVDTLRCKYGCRPPDGYLDDATSYRLLSAALRARE